MNDYRWRSNTLIFQIFPNPNTPHNIQVDTPHSQYLDEAGARKVLFSVFKKGNFRQSNEVNYISMTMHGEVTFGNTTTLTVNP